MGRHQTIPTQPGATHSSQGPHRRARHLSLVSLATGLSASLLCTAHQPSLAQELTGSTVIEETNQPRAKRSHEKIAITGSRIKRVDSEGTAPVTVIDRETIARSGALSVADLLRSGTGSPTGNFSGSTSYVRSGSATADLLGIGSGRTLVLLDGKRLPIDQSIGAVNIDNIPVTIIDRIELMRGGSSAVYGADAVGGVVNIVTLRNFIGNEASIRTSVPQHGGGENIASSALSAFQVGRAQMFISAGYSKTNEILARNRSYSKGKPPRDFALGLAPEGTYSYRLTHEDGSKDSWQPSDNCPMQNRVATSPNNPNDIYCAGKRSQTDRWIDTRDEEFFVTSRLQGPLTASTEFAITGLYNQKKSLTNMGNYLSTTDNPVTNRGIFLSPQRAQELGIKTGNATASDRIELLAKTQELSDRTNLNVDSTYGGMMSLESDLRSFTWASNVSYFRSTNHRYFNDVLNKEKQLNLMFPNDQSDPAYVPIDPNRDLGLVNSLSDDLRSSESSDGISFDTYIARELLNFPGGPLSILFGLGYSQEAYEQTPDDRDTQFVPFYLVPVYTGTAAVSGNGDRRVTSVFSELSAPVLKDLEVNLALRTDEYSDFGQTTNYSLGTKYQIVPGLMLRFNVASSFKAPNLSDLHADGGGGYLSIDDKKWCARERDRGNVCEPGTRHRIYVDAPGNQDLKQEVGRTYTIGAVMEPARHVSLLVDYIGVHLENTYGSDDIQDVVDNFYAGKSLGENVVRTDEDGLISSMGTPVQNLGTLDVHAVNAELDVSRKFESLAGIEIGLSSQYFRYFSYKVQEHLDQEAKQFKGYKGTPIWRMTNQLGVGKDQHYVSLTSSTIARQTEDPDEIEDEPGLHYAAIGEYTRYGTSYAFTAKKFSLIVGISNLFDKLGGLDDSGRLIGDQTQNSSLYSMRGRSFFASMKTKF